MTSSAMVTKLGPERDESWAGFWYVSALTFGINYHGCDDCVNLGIIVLQDSAGTKECTPSQSSGLAWRGVFVPVVHVRQLVLSSRLVSPVGS